MRVGILGGGQLAQMLALAGVPLGIRCRCLDPAPDAVAGQVAELVVGAYDDPAALARLIDGVEVVTFEFENVPVAALEWLAGKVPVRPLARALAVGQDRLQEKTLFRQLGMLVPQFQPASSREELHAAVAAVGTPCIVKTRRLGYDGRGQVRLQPGPGLAAAIDAAFAALSQPGTGGLIVEQWVPFTRELSVLAVRGPDGCVATWPLVENVHQGGILRRSTAPAPAVVDAVAQQAIGYARRLLEHLDYCGVLAIELFDVGGQLLANEMAPRVHNSGHWTIEGSVCSQFENHLRAVLGLPLGSTAMAGGGHAVMVNLISGMPAQRALLGLPGLHVHDYGKAPRAGRKLGHATVVGATAAAIADTADRAAALAAQHA
jgi:5-(carboxyamino)imidazole ribonucleotide synthase